MDTRLGTEGPNRLDDTDLFDFVASLPEHVVRQMFKGCRWSALGVLQRLSPLGKQLALRLLPLTQQAVDRTFFENCVMTDSAARSALKTALLELERLKVILAPPSLPGKYMLCEEFRLQVFQALTQVDIDRLPWQEGDVAKFRINVEDMESHARENWTVILHFIVGSNQYRVPEKRIENLLLTMGLMGRAGPYDPPRITKSGYHFMLKDIHNQLWLFIRHYMQQTEEPESVLQMLFKMSFCVPGTPCSTSSLNQTQLNLLKDFELVGLVYRHAKFEHLFFPTSLGVNVVFGQSREEKMAAAAKTVDLDASSSTSKPAEGKKIKSEPGTSSGGRKDRVMTNNVFIIVETNFKCYCYTESSLHVEMIKLFAEPECILPNMLVAIITRNSIRSALKMGITADQIIHFLTENAHPMCETRHRLVPDNVTDQIVLWEMERNRVVSKKAALLDKFLPQERARFNACVEFAERNGWLLYSSAEPMAVVVDRVGLREIKMFLSENK